MSIISDTLYSGMASSFEIGADVGREIMYHNDIQAWEVHCNAILEEIARLEDSNDRLETLSEKMDEIIVDWEDLVTDKEAEVEAGEDLLRAVQSQASVCAKDTDDYREFMVRKIVECDNRINNTNALIACYAEIFKQLSDQVARDSDPSRFEMMDPVKRNKKIVTAFADFIRSGKDNHSVDLDFTFIKNLKVAPQAQCCAP